jgi:hypothetical protein
MALPSARQEVTAYPQDAARAREPLALVIDLTPGQLDAIAERVVERLRPVPTRGALVDAATVARALGVSRDCVYAHAAELGGKRIGSGPRGRLRFDLDYALAAWISRSESGRSRQSKAPAQRQISRRVRSPRMGSGAELLPIRGSAGTSDAGRERS